MLGGHYWEYTPAPLTTLSIDSSQISSKSVECDMDHDLVEFMEDEKWDVVQ